MAMLKLQSPARKQAIDQQAEKCYVKTIVACTEAGYKPAGRNDGYVKIIGACNEAGYRPAGRQMAMLKLQTHALKQAVDQQVDKWLC